MRRLRRLYNIAERLEEKGFDYQINVDTSTGTFVEHWRKDEMYFRRHYGVLTAWKGTTLAVCTNIFHLPNNYIEALDYIESL